MRQIGTNELTRYEVTARHDDGRTFLVGYTPRKSAAGLLVAMQNVGAALRDVCGFEERMAMVRSASPHLHYRIGARVVGFTGRTQRDVRGAGTEHPFIARLAA